MNRYNELYEILTSVKSDFEKFYEKDKLASGARAKKALLALKKLSSVISKEITEKKKEIKANKTKSIEG